jgi:hypothetical protein
MSPVFIIPGVVTPTCILLNNGIKQVLFSLESEVGDICARDNSTTGVGGDKQELQLLKLVVTELK